MILLRNRGDNVVPPNLPALEAFMCRRAHRIEAPARARRAAWLRELARTPLQASFMPDGSNIHRARNIQFPDAGSADPFAALVTFLAHYDSVFTATPGGAAVLTGPPTLAGPPMFGAGAYTGAGAASRATYSGAVVRGNGALTVECWVRPVAFGTPRFVWGTTLVGGSFFMFMFLGAGGTYSYEFRGNQVDTGVVLATNVYTSICASTAAGTPVGGGLAFVNGVLVTTTTQTAGNGSSPSEFRVGNDVNGTADMAGAIDELRVTWAQRYTAGYTPAGPFPDP